MTVIQFGQGDPSTIMGGVILLIQQDMFGLAFVVFFASIAVPVIKLALLIFLLVSVQRRSPWRPKDRTLLYRVTEVVGAWSMVDIFLVGILSAIVQLGALATIEPGIGASFLVPWWWSLCSPPRALILASFGTMRRYANEPAKRPIAGNQST